MRYLALPLAVLGIVGVAFLTVWVIARFSGSQDPAQRRRIGWMVAATSVALVGGVTFLVLHYGFPTY